MAQTIREKAKIWQNREEDRPSEDDIARRIWTARPGRRAGYRENDGRQQIADAVPARPRPHGLAPGTLPGSGGCPGNARSCPEEKPRRSGAQVWDERALRVVELVPRSSIPKTPKGFRRASKNSGLHRFPGRVGTKTTAAPPSLAARSFTNTPWPMAANGMRQLSLPSRCFAIRAAGKRRRARSGVAASFRFNF